MGVKVQLIDAKHHKWLQGEVLIQAGKLVYNDVFIHITELTSGP